MLLVYRILINFIFILSPIILVIRLLKKKEDKNRFKEKFCFFSKRRKNGKVVWFHGASVGELQSVVPIFEILEKNKKINQILVTSNTLSSAKIIEKLKLKKVKLSNISFSINGNKNIYKIILDRFCIFNWYKTLFLR